MNGLPFKVSLHFKRLVYHAFVSSCLITKANDFERCFELLDDVWHGSPCKGAGTLLLTYNFYKL